MAEDLSYLELMQALERPDPLLYSRVQLVSEGLGNGSEMPVPCGNNEIPVNEDPSSSNWARKDCYYDSGSETSLEDPDSTDDEGDSRCTRGNDGSLGVLEGIADEDRSVDLSDDGVEDPDYFSYMLPIRESSSEDEDVEQDLECTIVPSPVITAAYPAKDVESAPLYKKRRRHKKGEKLPSSRVSTRMGPVETALRSSGQRKSKYIFEPVVGTSFDSVAEAYEFYNLYSWEKGFGISYGRNDTNRGNDYRTMQELHCSCQGKDNRCVHQSIRRGCKASVRLLRTDDHGWYISKFEVEHNHELSESYGEKMQWGSHRRIDENAKNMIKHLRDNNVPLGKCHSIMGSLYGSVQDLPFTKRCLRTLCEQLAREQMDDDIKKTLVIFRQMRKEDPDFCYSVDVDKHNRIKTLIWTNHRSKMQYQCFGDVFTFDTTFCTNIYKMPFGLFVGVNNHFQSVIFAGVLMRKETIKSFTWVFNEFLSLMGGKAPITILTDQAQAMIPALEKSMPNTTHLWCKWHVLRKAQESLGPLYSKKSEFRQEFHKVLNEMLTIDEFESAWDMLIKKFKLVDHPFMIRIYESRVKWAKPYSKTEFCARMMSTQRGESANHMLKTYVRGMSTMNNFVAKYSDMIFDRAMEEDREEHKSKLVKKCVKQMWPIQTHAYKVYTRASFKLFTAELEKSYQYVVPPPENSECITVKHAYSKLREPWVRVTFKVTVSQARGIYECECGLFTHFGILCCHCIRVMNYLGVANIPPIYIMKRWTKDARDILPVHLRFLQKDSRAMKSHTCRDNLLYGTAMKAVKVGNQDLETFAEMMKHLGNGIKSVADIVAARGEPEPDQPDQLYESSDNEWHRAQRPGYNSGSDGGMHGRTLYSHDREGGVPSNFDLNKLKGPLVEKSKGGRSRVKRFLSPVEGKPKKRKKASISNSKTTGSMKQTSFCSFCKLAGHRRNNCPANTESVKKQKKKSCCSTCKLPGHTATSCHKISPNIDDFDIDEFNVESDD